MSFLGRRSAVYFSIAIGLQRTHESSRLHRFDQPGRAVVADLEAPLHAGNRRLACLGDDAYGFIVERIRFCIPGTAFGAILLVRWKSRNGIARSFQDLL